MPWTSGKKSPSKCATASDDVRNVNELFGIRSYLHSFYVSADPEEEDLPATNPPKTFQADNYFNYDSDDSDDEDDADGTNEGDGLTSLPRKCRKLKRTGTRRLRQSVKRSKRYVNDLKVKINDLNDKRSISKCYQCTYRFVFTIGIVSLLLAMVGLIVVCSVSERDLIVGRQEEIEIIDQSALMFNNNLILLRTISLVLAAFGMLMICCIFVLPVVYGIQLTDEHDETECLQEILADPNSNRRVYVKVDQNDVNKQTNESECDDVVKMSAIPASEQISSVQPQREQNESMLTSSGFTQLST